ncbi:hypothetical protein H3N56_02655 [Cetobacterium sp. 2A]|uniref:hypothetical protein n=1 Tax=Cetobacterium sp. 2A TaxID=2754723 RepID=UPI00163BF705|nr:hypothetical protein [Cetobacterium sp. 2A]MBC2855394.1 hypothetical protein [Cetobacterium sp. 2A]
MGKLEAISKIISTAIICISIALMVSNKSENKEVERIEITEVSKNTLNDKEKVFKWRSKVDNKNFNIKYKITNELENKSTLFYDRDTEEEGIRITNELSKDKIIIKPMYANHIQRSPEERAAIFNGKFKKKYSGYEIYNTEKPNPSFIFFKNKLCLIEYYKVDGKLNKIYDLVTKTINGVSPKG